MKFLEEKPSIVLEAQKAKFSPNIVVQFLLFLAVFFVGELATGIVSGLTTLPFTLKALKNSGVDLTDANAVKELSLGIASSPTIVLLSLVFTIIATVLTIIYCRYIEKRSLYSMGFVDKSAFSDYVKGMLIGFVMFSVALLICIATGAVSYYGTAYSGNILLLFCFLFGFMFQGLSEEVICRGYFMVTVAAKKPLLLAILANSVIFGLMHCFNKGVTVLSVINIVLIGIFFSVYMLKSDSIWGVCSIHAIWNFVQGNFYGIKVSGIDTGVTVFKFASSDNGNLINGGEFGLEGGLAVTVVIVISIVLTLLWKGKKSELAVIEQPEDVQVMINPEE